MPDLVILGGVNGAGKSTIFPAIKSSERIDGSFQPNAIEDAHFINADEIEQQLGLGEIVAAKETISNTYKLINEGENICLESTLSGKGFVMNVIKSAKNRNYRIYIVYMILYSPELSMARVVQRALQGKHYIPMSRIFDRYRKSVINFFSYYKDYSSFWVVVDNSKLSPSVLCWGGSIYQEKIIFRESIDSFAPLLEIFKFNDIDISFNNFGVELFSPTVFKKIKEQVDLEIKKRPLETTVVYQDRGKIMFTKRKIHTRHNN